MDTIIIINITFSSKIRFEYCIHVFVYLSIDSSREKRASGSCHRGRVVIILKGMRFRGYPRLSIIERIIIDQIGDSVVARFNGKRFALSDAS